MNRFVYVLVYFLLSNLYGFSQSIDYRLNNLSTLNGLSQSSVISIHQDQLGQMWFGTRDGLNKYDGHDFTIFKNKPTDSLSISNNDILAIEESKDSTIWVGTYNGLNRFNPVNKTFKRFFHKKNKNSLSNNTIWCVKEIQDEIWIGTSNGLSIYNTNTNKFVTLYHSDEDSSSIADNFILSILQTKDGNIWIGTAKGLNKLITRDNDNFSFKTYITSDNSKALFIQDIKEDANNNLFIGTKYSGLLKFNLKSNEFISVSNINNLNEIGNDIRALDFDHKGDLWVGTYDGIYVLSSNGIMLKPIDTSNLDKVKSVYTDRNGSVWIGTYYKGVNIWDISNINFTNLNENSGDRSLSFDAIGSMAKDINNNLYFGTEGGGITILDNKTGKTKFINTKNSKVLNSDNIKSLYLSEEGLLWIGTFTHGISIYNIITQKFEINKLNEDLQNILRKSGVYDIKKAGENILWIGTFGNGIIRYNIKDKTYLEIGNTNKVKEQLSNLRVRSILIDKNQAVWVGTQSGLNVLKPTDINFNSYNIKNFFFDNELQSGDDILSIFRDSNDRIWVGIKGKGLFLYNGDSFDKIDLGNENIKITTVHSILEDSNKNLWLGSNQGIIKYNYMEDAVIIYDQRDGIVSNEFNDNACLNIGDDTIFFGGPAGVTYFKANNIVVNKYSPQVLLTDFKVKNESLIIGGDLNILNKSITYTNELILSYDNANFSVNFAIPNFINAANNKYVYRLIGLDNQWITTTSTEANYTIQTPGTYQFEVKGANNDGVWNTHATVLKIIVKPAPWRSTWALLFYALLLAFSIYGLIWIMKSRARLQYELEMEHIESKRNEDLNQAKLQFFTNISHEFRTPLTLILGPLQQILLDYNGSNTMYKKLMVIESSANHLLRLINRLMDFRKLENNQFRLESAEGNIVKFLHEIFLSFSEFAKDGNYTYNFKTTHEEILVYYDRYKLERVFYNLISNAFRYTPKGGVIEFNISKLERDILIEISDTGVGITEEHIDKIFDRFFEVHIHNKPQENYNQGTGIGLSIAKNIVKLHKGSIHVKNKKEKGAIFSVLLPLGKAHLLENEILQNFKISDDVTQYESQLKNNDVIIEDDINDLVVNEEKYTILLVEDNKPLRSFMKNLLKKDYNILEAENGSVAMKKAIKYVPDLIISDVIMPEMVGTELCAGIKENLKTSHIPVILLTSRTSLIYKVEGLESGADDYISKPFNLKEFKLRIKNLLESTKRLKDKFSNENNFTPSDITVSSLDEELLKKAIDIVERHISNDQFDIAFFCSELGIGRTMLFTKIKAWTNFTPNEFIQEIRLKTAAKLLEQNKINISQICYKVGFRDPKYFGKCFQKKYGVTPSQYIKKFNL
ncbi:hybrid sensor histidine kinase/response regulator transcription factor [Siansivirga zeaxanthinifaciens]|uniref:histidine kinase n=1 Tax=Siansivirga zeaxanthinifaciens CC-SAMT-1 TaxID=1454006 RepID=A0A0C5WDX5_9FLAO|nr:hybrid sensor histidine kinase/response regulator transcription factor [Siansivirga zeaxanthinifaciens]AJR04467.1 histidine kinase [Siansivirga zeaxanthinifaciens CC-SAMT-1]